ELVLAETGQLGGVARYGTLVEELGAEPLKPGNLRLVVGLLRGNYDVLVFAGVSDEGCCFSPDYRVGVDTERHFAIADEPSQHDFDGTEVPAVGLGLEAVNDLLDRHLFAQASLGNDPRLHLSAWRVQYAERPRAEKPLVLLHSTGDLL